MPKKKTVQVPQNTHEAAELLAKIGNAQRRRNEINLVLNNKIEALKTAALAEEKPYEEEVKELIEGLYIYAEANRKILTQRGSYSKKSVELLTGIFGWRTTSPAVKLGDTIAVLESLKQLGLNQFIRVKEEVNKVAMLAEQDLATTVAGVSITQREEFFVKPKELQFEVVTSIKKLKKRTRRKKRNTPIVTT